ncbi:magnesium transporter [Halosimplex amylolyticum]|uniref:magnesium transporter n=1 Tax=Halosimplex amylolyticum TaxID=3396616 RepID=UPI003F558126
MADDWSVGGITRRMFPIIVALTLLELVGGLTLGSFEATLRRYPSLLVLVPVTIGTAGNLGSVLSARLSTAFHLGVLSFAATDEELLGNTITTVLLAVTVFPVVGAGAWAIAQLTGGAGLQVETVVIVALVSGFVLALLAIAVTITAAYTAYRFEADPDEVVIPVVTNVCDVLGVVVLFGVVQVIVA